MSFNVVKCVSEGRPSKRTPAIALYIYLKQLGSFCGRNIKSCQVFRPVPRTGLLIGPALLLNAPPVTWLHIALL